MEETDFDKLKRLVGNINSLVKKPEPGLACWHMILSDKCKELRDLLNEKYQKQ